MSFQDFISQYQDIFATLETYARNNPNNLLIAAIVGVVLLIVLQIFSRNKKRLQKNKAHKKNMAATNQDMNAIAGEDVMATQLDLARAYIEMGKTALAQQILQQVLKKGDLIQKQKARELINSIL